MADENQTPNENAQNAEAQQAQPSFQMVRSYLKDASLEMPHAPEIFFAAPEEHPNVTVKEKTMFLVEGKQAGIFDIRNIVEEGVQHLTNVVCPSILYPYLRANLADLITRTGLPPVHLPEVNFEALYQQRLAQAQQQAQQGAAEGVAHA